MIGPVRRWNAVFRAYAPLRRKVGFIFPLMVITLVLSALGLLFHRSLNAFSAFLIDNAGFQSRGQVNGGGESVQRLFREIVARQLVALDVKTGRLSIQIDCGAVRAGYGPSGDRSMEAMVRRLCDSDVGNRLLSEIEVWNSTLGMLAVRDTFGHAEGLAVCDDQSTYGHFIPAQCHGNKWSPAHRIGAGVQPVDLRRSEPPPAGIYGFLARPPVTGFGDWHRLDAAATGAREMMLRRDFPPRLHATEIRIDVIGLSPSLTVNGVTGPVPRLLCHGARTETACRSLLVEYDRTPHAYRFTLTLPAGRRNVVEIRSRAVQVLPVEMAGLADAMIGPKPALEGFRLRPDEILSLTRHIILNCRTDSAEDYVSDIISYESNASAGDALQKQEQRKACELDWQPRESVRQVRRGQIVVNAGDDRKPVSLTEIRTYSAIEAAHGKRQALDEEEETRPVQEVVPSVEAVRLGLLPLIGLGEADRYSLIGQAVRQKAGQSGVARLDLTLDPVLQEIALSQLRQDIPATDQTPVAPDSFAPARASERRAAIVLVDAGEVRPLRSGGGFDARTGSVLAAASLPLVPPNKSYWDLIAADSYRAAESLLAARGWAQNDRHFAPGSTFKTVVSLAAIDTALRGNSAVSRALGLETGSPGLTAGQLEGVFGKAYGFSYQSRALEVGRTDDLGRVVQTARIGNFGKVALCDMARASGPSAAGSCSANGQLNLMGALTTSNNMWFARMALLLDEDKLVTTSANGRRSEKRGNGSVHEGEPLVLRTMLNRVWSAGAIDLVPGFKALYGPPAHSRFAQLCQWHQPRQ